MALVRRGIVRDRRLVAPDVPDLPDGAGWWWLFRRVAQPSFQQRPKSTHSMTCRRDDVVDFQEWTDHTQGCMAVAAPELRTLHYTPAQTIQNAGHAHVSGVEWSEHFAWSTDGTRGELARVRALVGQFVLIPMNSAASLQAYQLVDAYFPSHGLQLRDALIAAAAMEASMTLYTRNVRDFQMIPRIRLVRPY